MVLSLIGTEVIILRPEIIQEYISISTGFFTLCFSYLSGFFIGMFSTLLKIYNPFYLALVWLSHLAVIPIIWIASNKKMKGKVKTILIQGSYEDS